MDLKSIGHCPVRVRLPPEVLINKTNCMKSFRKLGDHSLVDLIPHVKTAIENNEDTKIYIGSDSQNEGGLTTYATVVVLHYGNRGANVLYHRERIPKVVDTFTRLWDEVERSIEVAEYMQANGLPKADFIDLDFNPDPVYRSNMVLRAAVGYVESMGYTARTKPGAPAASHCADAICH
jgi:predicted RNase H-related nuclease YkuK (DUF458 family)